MLSISSFLVDSSDIVTSVTFLGLVFLFFLWFQAFDFHTKKKHSALFMYYNTLAITDLDMTFIDVQLLFPTFDEIHACSNMGENLQGFAL